MENNKNENIRAYRELKIKVKIKMNLYENF